MTKAKLWWEPEPKEARESKGDEDFARSTSVIPMEVLCYPESERRVSLKYEETYVEVFALERDKGSNYTPAC